MGWEYKAALDGERLQNQLDAYDRKLAEARGANSGASEAQLDGDWRRRARRGKKKRRAVSEVQTEASAPGAGSAEQIAPAQRLRKYNRSAAGPFPAPAPITTQAQQAVADALLLREGLVQGRAGKRSLIVPQGCSTRVS
jgi:hypothetical protein